MDEIYNFEIMLDAGRQPEKVVSVAWDQKNQKATQPSTANTDPLEQGNIVGDEVAKVAAKIGADTCRLAVAAPLDPKELQSWADARLARSRLSMIRGRVAIPGNSKVKPMDVVEIAGVAHRFNGKALVTGVRHRVDERGWRTDVQFGLSPEWYCRRDDIGDPPAAGLLPAAQGLQVGVVDKFEQDPDKEYRARVLLPLPTADDKPFAVWARLASPDAGNGRGYFFRPEPGDEVVVGFFNNDPRQPVILGALFGSKNAPPKDVSQLTDKNVHKAIVTKKGTTIGFIDEDEPSVYIQTPGKNKITIDDQDESVKIEDQHGNSITLNKNGITIKSARTSRSTSCDGPDRPGEYLRMRELELKVTIDEANLILEGLGNLPFAKVFALVAKIQEQAARQIRGAGAAGVEEGAARAAAEPVNSHE